MYMLPRDLWLAVFGKHRSRAYSVIVGCILNYPCKHLRYGIHVLGNVLFYTGVWFYYDEEWISDQGPTKSCPSQIETRDPPQAPSPIPDGPDFFLAYGHWRAQPFKPYIHPKLKHSTLNL